LTLKISGVPVELTIAYLQIFAALVIAKRPQLIGQSDWVTDSRGLNMNWIELRKIAAFSLVIASASTSVIFTERAFSYTHKLEQSRSPQLIAKRKRPLRWNPPNLGAPGNRKPGGVRNSCPVSVDRPMLVALVPPTNLGLTISDRPIFWFYLGNLPPSMGNAEFTLQNPKEEIVYRSNFPLPKQAGIINFSLPSQKQYSLVAEQKYTWYLKVYCDPASNKDYIFVKGAVQRKAISLPQDYISYAADGIWYDAITNLANQYRQKPKDPELKQDWIDLLQEIGLKEISQEPLLPCCTLSK